MRTLVIGDIHGNYLALRQCLERSAFDKENDTLISLGDIVDGWHESYECIEELLSIKNLIAIKGNHDHEFLHWIERGSHNWNWSQGAFATAQSYANHAKLEKLVKSQVNSKYELLLTTVDIPKSHQQFFKDQKLYYEDSKSRFFVHGGFNRHYHILEQDEFVFYWDRDLWSQALSWESMAEFTFKGSLEKKPAFKFNVLNDFSEIFIGHTSTQFWDKSTPMKAANIWNLDTGAGWNGKLTIMDVDTKEYWQSDTGSVLYPGKRGR